MGCVWLVNFISCCYMLLIVTVFLLTPSLRSAVLLKSHEHHITTWVALLMSMHHSFTRNNSVNSMWHFVKFCSSQQQTSVNSTVESQLKEHQNQLLLNHIDDKREWTNDYFIGKLLVINCWMNTLVLKYISRNWTIAAIKPKFRGSAHLCSKTTIPQLGSNFCWPSKAVVCTDDACDDEKALSPALKELMLMLIDSSCNWKLGDLWSEECPLGLCGYAILATRPDPYPYCCTRTRTRTRG